MNKDQKHRACTYGGDNVNACNQSHFRTKKNIQITVTGRGFELKYQWITSLYCMEELPSSNPNKYFYTSSQSSGEVKGWNHRITEAIECEGIELRPCKKPINTIFRWFDHIPTLSNYRIIEYDCNNVQHLQSSLLRWQEQNSLILNSTKTEKRPFQNLRYTDSREQQVRLLILN